LRRIHVALAVDDLDATITDYSTRLGAQPVAVVPGKYALWRTAAVNLSVNAGTPSAQRLRHLGFEDDGATEKTEDRDPNGITWESFSPSWQDEALVRAYGEPLPPTG
jgi:catechol 2,3-dioxygenase-like lactoylglutathione lyase family enzyme